MTQHLFSKDVARLLNRKPYQVAYAISVGQVPEPELPVANKRVFQAKDLRRLAVHFGVNLHDDSAGQGFINSKITANHSWGK